MNPFDQKAPNRTTTSRQGADQHEESRSEIPSVNRGSEILHPFVSDNVDNNLHEASVGRSSVRPGTSMPPPIDRSLTTTRVRNGALDDLSSSQGNGIRPGLHLPSLAIYPDHTSVVQPQYPTRTEAGTEAGTPFGPPLRPVAPVSTGNEHVSRNHGTNVRQHGVHNGASFPGPMTHPTSTGINNPYCARARQIGTNHGIEGLGRLHDHQFDPPPPWKPGDDPITPAEASRLYEAALAEAEDMEKTRRESFRSLPEEQQAELRRDSESRMSKHIALLDSMLTNRISIYQEFIRTRRERHMQAQENHGQLMHQSVNMNAPMNPHGVMAQQVAGDRSHLMPPEPTVTPQEIIAGWRPIPTGQSNPATRPGAGLIRQSMNAALERHQARLTGVRRHQQEEEWQPYMAPGSHPNSFSDNMPSTFPVGSAPGEFAASTFPPQEFNGSAATPPQFSYPYPSTTSGLNLTSLGLSYDNPNQYIGAPPPQYNYPPPSTTSGLNLSSLGPSYDDPSQYTGAAAPSQYNYPPPSPTAGWNLSSVGLPDKSRSEYTGIPSPPRFNYTHPATTSDLNLSSVGPSYDSPSQYTVPAAPPQFNYPPPSTTSGLNLSSVELPDNSTSQYTGAAAPPPSTTFGLSLSSIGASINSTGQNTGVASNSISQGLGFATASGNPRSSRKRSTSKNENSATKTPTRNRPSWAKQVAEADLPKSVISQQALDAGRQWREGKEGGKAPAAKAPTGGRRNRPAGNPIPENEMPTLKISSRAAHQLISKGYVKGPDLPPKAQESVTSSQTATVGMVGTIETSSSQGTNVGFTTATSNPIIPQDPSVTASQNAVVPNQGPAANTHTSTNEGNGVNAESSRPSQPDNTNKESAKKNTKTATPKSDESSLTDISSSTPDDPNDGDYRAATGQPSVAGASSRKRKAGGTPGANKRTRP